MMPEISKKLIKRIFVTLSILIGVSVVLILGYLAALVIAHGPVYTYRVLVYGESSITDYTRVFPSRAVQNQAPAFNFPAAEQAVNLGRQLTYTYAGKQKVIEDFEKYLKQSSTTALIIVKNDKLLYEKYFNGYTRDSINRSFSAAKSFTSTLVGLAVQDGYIHSIDDTIITYLPELKGSGLDTMTIRDLMLMNSGIPWTSLTDGCILFYPFYNDDSLTYYLPDMRAHVLSLHGSAGPIGSYFYYHNAYPLLEGIILERTTHKTASAYLEEKIWKPLGMEYPASWSLDSQESGLEQMGGGLNARSIDFAKFARLFLNDGYWNGKQLLPSGWVKEATSPDPTDNRPFKTNPEWKEMGGYYKYHWWGMRNNDDTYDYAALGHLGQIIYISPGNNAFVIRNGASGDSLEWGIIARSIIQLLK
jgi:CubicO group peptidase (beta-lactamase class C family)